MKDDHPHEPVPEEEMADIDLLEETRFAGQRTICQTLREIWAVTTDESARRNIRVAMAMAKAMHAKLLFYKSQTQDS